MSATSTTSSAKGARRVALMREQVITYPELWLEVFVAGDSSEQRAFADMFTRSRCLMASEPLKADLVVFTGGVDVDPALYGAKKHPKTETPSPERDQADMAIYKICLDNGIPMLGVCRGAQFLHVMNGGKLYQHVTNHYGDHSMWIKDAQGSRNINVSSVHHQAVVPNEPGGMKILGDASKAATRFLETEEPEKGHHFDVEAFFYPDTCCLGVHGNPEYRGYPEFANWTLEQIRDLIVSSPDTEQRDRYRRLKQVVIDSREMAAKLAIANNVEIN